MNKIQTRTVSVCLSPALLPSYNLEESIVVVIDIFRASSSICYGIHNGADAIIPVLTVDDCKKYSSSDFLLAAERNGAIVEGFAFGNSPFSYTEEKVRGRTIVLTTTNGTRSIQLSKTKQAKKVLIGSFLNISALSHWLMDQQHSVVLLCAGWKENFSLEDTLFAGAVVEKLKESFIVNDDAAHAAYDLYTLAKGDIAEYLKKSSHSERLEKLNIEADIEFCLQLDVVDSIPVLENDRLVKLG
ncbi:2-phosphosulfolactate phosphatase [Albibacterium indicum]|uniref:2-phosphosulfolactate phosphatase n=1 Tax=Albibacterium indicum TaxID=2292082 RepID=UPI00293736AF|nr:2-phosphosulfolactate phosphatase [Pedobacter indicus]